MQREPYREVRFFLISNADIYNPFMFDANFVSCSQENIQLTNSIWQGGDDRDEYLELYLELKKDKLISQFNSSEYGYVPNNCTILKDYYSTNSLWIEDSLERRKITLRFELKDPMSGIVITPNSDTIYMIKYKEYSNIKELRYEFNEDLLFIDRKLSYLSALYPDSIFTIERITRL